MRIIYTKKWRRKKRQKRLKKDNFYESEAWLTLRYRVLKFYGAKCSCCGSTKKPMHVDHIKPRSRYPHLELEFSNLQVLCKACNKGKRAWDETDWRSPPPPPPLPEE